MRAEVAAAMPIVDRVESAAAKYVDEHGAYPSSPTDIGLPESSATGPVSQIQITEEGFELTLQSTNAQLDGKTIVVGAYRNDNDAVAWHCTGGTLESKHRPLKCRNP